MNPRFFGMLKICALSFCIATPALSQNVVLNSIDGSITMTGELLSFDGENFVLKTAIGEISIAAAQVNCEGEACPDPVADIKEFSIVGSNAIADTLLPTLIEAYALERGGDLQVEFGESGQTTYYVLDAEGDVYSTISIQSGSSDDAFAALADGTATIGISSRSANQTEIEEFLNLGFGDLNSAEQEKIIALDGIVAVVHRDNPVAALSLDQISQIFAGDVTNWQQLGGLNAPITLYRRDENSGTSSVFHEMAMAPSGRDFAQTANILDTNSAVSDAVSRDMDGIGISNIADQRNARAVALRAICGQVFVPSDFTIKTEEYPLSRRMFLYTSSATRPDRANELVEFLSSNIAQDIAENAGFVGQNVTRIPLDQQGRRIANAIVAESNQASFGNLQNLLTTVLDAERLSLTFRFVDGTSTLENRAANDIDRLAAMIRDGDFANRQILVLGFTDNIGTLDESAELSQANADQVREAIITAIGAENLGNTKISPVGYGNISPLSCNETPAGRRTNRRVELWIR